MSDLKNRISRYMWKVTLIMGGVILVFATILQMLNEQSQARESAEAMLYQMEQILEENQKDLSEIEAGYAQTCLHNAELIAYIVQCHPSLMESAEELKKIAEYVEVDEIHIFDGTGSIFAGSHPEYYNLTFDSGEQIGFFKPLLQDKNLKLCQDITPNTAEGKLMQYSALWSENGEFIVQVGMEPVNVMRVTEKNELSYIFSLLRVNVGVTSYAIDAKSGVIIGSSEVNDVGKNLTEVGFRFDRLKDRTDGFHAKVNGVGSYCVFKKVGNEYIGQVIANSVIYRRTPSSIGGLTVCLLLIVWIQVRVVLRYVNNYVIDGIYHINDKLREISKGKLDEKVDEQSSLEFSELSNHINEMVRSLVSNRKKMTHVLNKTNMYIGVYEYNEKVPNVRFSEYIPRILGLDDSKVEQFSSDCNLFKTFMGELRNQSLSDEEGVFCLKTEECVRYIKVEEVIEDKDVFGVVIDVTEEIVKRKQIEAERDVDTLTGLYNRRGLDAKLSFLFREPEKLEYGALIMIDADGLKQINDEHGHEKGDMYLKKISEILKGFGIKGSLAARQGGDEFVLFLYQYDSKEELINTIKTLEYIQQNGTAFLGKDLSVPLKFSYGVSFINGEKDYQKLIKKADEKMYANKRERKSMV